MTLLFNTNPLVVVWKSSYKMVGVIAVVGERYKWRWFKSQSSVFIKMEFIVDVQGFKKSINQFVFKELAIVPLQEDVQPTVYLFEPSNHWNSLTAKYKSENAWLTRHYHGLEWFSGDIPYDELRLIIRDTLRSASALYVKGLEKKKWVD